MTLLKKLDVLEKPGQFLCSGESRYDALIAVAKAAQELRTARGHIYDPGEEDRYRQLLYDALDNLNATLP